MPLRRPKADPPASITVQQVVAYNFRLIRELRGWTQKRTSDELEPYLGYHLKQAGVSSIERTFDSDRQRTLDAAEIAAFARCFDVPIDWFFVPPPEMVNTPVEKLGTMGDGSPALGIDLLAVAIGNHGSYAMFVDRLRQLVEHRDRDVAARAADVIRYQLTGESDADLERRMEHRRQLVRDKTMIDQLDRKDELIEQMAETFIELMSVTAPRFRKLRHEDPLKALELLSTMDYLVDDPPLTPADLGLDEEE